ncbi:MAG: hypothetical protein RSG50_04075 [Clostridia bacterium]
MNKTQTVPLAQAAFKDVSTEELGVMLLGDVFAELSCYVLWDEDGNGALKAFDTYDSEQALNRDWPVSGRLVLYTNHPETGAMTPSEDDLRNLKRMPERTELFAVCEALCAKA